MWEEKLEIYDAIVSKCPHIKRLGKTMPYTATNGYMFSLLNKAGEIGIRFSTEVQKKFIEEHGTTIYKSYGAVMKDYALIPEKMLENQEAVASLLNQSYDYFNSIAPNKHKR